jgi:hypothetical protein
MPFDPDLVAPTGLRTAEFVLRPIAIADAERDFAAVMESRDYLRLWEQSTWPADDFTIDENRADLEGLAERHRDRRAFTFTVSDPEDTACLGCVYVFPTDAAFLAKSSVTALGDLSWDDVDAVVYFWVRASRMETGMHERLLDALRRWFDETWRLNETVFVTNERFERQRELLDATDLQRRFELREPVKAGVYLAFGRTDRS